MTPKMTKTRLLKSLFHETTSSSALEALFLKKSQTCEGWANLRISFWHLVMNFKKPEKSEF